MSATYKIAQAPIHLVQVFYPISEFRVNLQYGEHRAKEEPLSMNVSLDDIQFADRPGQLNEFVAEMQITLTWNDVIEPPYQKAVVRTGGIFSLNPDAPEDQKQFHKSVSSISMLYSGLREFVRAATSSGPWGAIMLPALQFKPVSESESDS